MENNGNHLKRLRLLAGLTQEQVADALGIQKATISKYEKGHRRINTKHLDKLAELYNADPFYILTGRKQEEAPKESTAMREAPAPSFGQVQPSDPMQSALDSFLQAETAFVVNSYRQLIQKGLPTEEMRLEAAKIGLDSARRFNSYMACLSMKPTYPTTEERAAIRKRYEEKNRYATASRVIEENTSNEYKQLINLVGDALLMEMSFEEASEPMSAQATGEFILTAKETYKKEHGE